MRILLMQDKGIIVTWELRVLQGLFEQCANTYTPVLVQKEDHYIFNLLRHLFSYISLRTYSISQADQSIKTYFIQSRDQQLSCSAQWMQNAHRNRVTLCLNF